MSWENINKATLLVFSKPSKHLVQINFFCMSNSWSIYMCHNFSFPPRLENPFFWPHDDLFRSFLALGLAKEWKLTRCKKITNNVLVNYQHCHHHDHCQQSHHHYIYIIIRWRGVRRQQHQWSSWRSTSRARPPPPPCRGPRGPAPPHWPRWPRQWRQWRRRGGRGCGAVSAGDRW